MKTSIQCGRWRFSKSFLLSNRADSHQEFTQSHVEMSEHSRTKVALDICQSSRKNIKRVSSPQRVIAEHDPLEEAHHKGPMLLCKTHQEKLLELYNCFWLVLSLSTHSTLFHFAFNNFNTTPILYALTRVCLAKEGEGHPQTDQEWIRLPDPSEKLGYPHELAFSNRSSSSSHMQVSEHSITLTLYTNGLFSNQYVDSTISTSYTIFIVLVRAAQVARVALRQLGCTSLTSCRSSCRRGFNECLFFRLFCFTSLSASREVDWIA